MKSRVKNISPLRYPGGKTRARKILDEIYKLHFDVSKHSVVYSPFFGGGSFEFYLQDKYLFDLIVNDKFTPLISFWQYCKDNRDELCLNIRNNLYPATKEQCLEYRKSILNSQDILQLWLASYFFVLNRCSFSGSTLSGGFSKEACEKRFTSSSIDRIEKLNLENIQFHNQDFANFLNDHSKTWDVNKSFMFLDPPYYLEEGSNLYGTKGDLHDDFDHQKLKDILLSDVNIDWMMTYNNHPIIKEWYKDCIIIEVDWKYGMNKTKKSSEIVICSNIKTK